MQRLSFIRKTWRTGHYLMAGAIMFMVVLLGVVYGNIDAIVGLYQSTTSLFDTGSFIIALLSGITVLLSPLGVVSLFLFGLLLGLNTVLLLQYIYRKRRQTICIEYPDRGGTVSTISGTVAAIFGIGCAACGSAILLAFLNIFGAGGLLLWLPLHGEEFSIIGILLLTYATWLLLGKANS